MISSSGSSLLAFFLLPKSKSGAFTRIHDYTMKPLRGNSGIFTESGGTIGWHISKDGIVVVDSQFPEQAGHLIEEIRKISDLKINYLINTHHHFDHTAGNIAFKEVAEVILAHENSKINQVRTAEERDNANDQLFPDTVFKDNWSGNLGSETISAHYFGPAHTNGDAVIHFENDNIAHVGDLVFNRRFPYIDMKAGASIINWIDVLKKISNYYDSDTLYIFGHSSEGFHVTGSKNDLSAMANYLSKVIDLVERDLKAGKSNEDILKYTSIPGAEDWTGGGIQTSLNSAIEELTKK